MTTEYMQPTPEESSRGSERLNKPPSQFEQIINNLNSLQIAGLDPAQKTPEWQQRYIEATQQRDHFLGQAKGGGWFNDIDLRLEGLYGELRRLRVRPGDLVDVVSKMRMVDLESSFWRQPRQRAYEQSYRGVRDEYYQTALVRMEDNLLNTLVDPNEPPSAAWEWDMLDAERKRRAAWLAGRKFIEHTEGNGAYELLVDGPEDVYLALKDLLLVSESKMKLMDPGRTVQTVNSIYPRIIDALKNAALKTGLSEKQESKLFYLVETRLLFFAGQSTARAGDVKAFHEIMMSGIENNFKEHIVAILEDLEVLPYLASFYLEQNNGEYFRLPTRERDERKDQIINKLSGRRLKEDHRAVLVQGNSLKDLEYKADPETLFDQLTEVTEKNKTDAVEAFEVAERILDVLGVTSRHAVPRIIEGGIEKSLDQIVIERLGGVPIYFLNFALDDGLRERILKGEFEDNNEVLAKIKKIIDPDNQGMVVTKEQALDRLEQERRRYYEKVVEIRREYAGRIRFGSGGVLAHRRVHYHPEYVRNNPRLSKSKELADGCELFVKDFYLGEGCWTTQDLMRMLNNPVDQGGNLIGGFDFGYWNIRFNNANEQRARFTGGTAGGQSYAGLLREPLANPWSLRTVDIQARRNMGIIDLFRENPMLMEPYIESVGKVVTSFVATVSGFSYLNDRSPHTQAAEYAAVFLHKFLEHWLNTSKEPEEIFGYPPNIKRDEFKESLKRVMARNRLVVR